MKNGLQRHLQILLRKDCSRDANKGIPPVPSLVAPLSFSRFLYKLHIFPLWLKFAKVTSPKID